MASTTPVTDIHEAAAPVVQHTEITRRRRFSWSGLRGYLGITAIVVFCLAPAYWMVVTAFRDVGYTFDTTPWPTHVTLSNFRTAFDTSLGNHFGRSLVNSLIIGVFTTLLAVMAGVFAAYAISRLNFPGKFLVLGVVLGASMFPGVALLSPLFQLFTDIHWIGTYQALIIPDISFALPLTVYTLTAFFAEMPWELEESAPGIFTTAILAFISSWNEYLLASELSSDKTQPVTVAIAQFTGNQPHQEPYTAIMAAGTIVCIPLVIMVLLLQRRIVAGLTAGGVKG